MVDKRKPVILGVSSPSPREVIELADYAAKVGGDLVQVLMPLRPWGGQPTIAELMEFYTQVASASPLPVVAYHNPGPGADPPQDAFVRISEINNIRYFKESSRDITKISRLIEQIDLAGKGTLFHHHAAAPGDADDGRLGRHDAAAGHAHRSPGRRGFSRR
jgi:4-hydroxy-tetrahydrodipicolinate synthase